MQRIWPTEKLLTPMARIFPCLNSVRIASAVSSIVTNGSMLSKKGLRDGLNDDSC